MEIKPKPLSQLLHPIDVIGVVILKPLKTLGLQGQISLRNALRRDDGSRLFAWNGSARPALYMHDQILGSQLSQLKSARLVSLIMAEIINRPKPSHAKVRVTQRRPRPMQMGQ